MSPEPNHPGVSFIISFLISAVVVAGVDAVRADGESVSVQMINMSQLEVTAADVQQCAGASH